MSKTIVFVRHGESEANEFIHNKDPDFETKINIGDPHLTPKGHEQAKATADYLFGIFKKKPCKNVTILVSPFTRTKQTAQPFIDLMSFPQVQETTLLTEYTKPDKTIPNELTRKGVKNHPSWEHFLMQMRLFVLELVTHESDLVFVFGHSLFLSAMTTFLECGKAPSKDQLVFRFPNCSITTFLYSDLKWKITCTASTIGCGKLVTGEESEYGTIIA
jgi:broad specificity phosphatase PhoE